MLITLKFVIMFLILKMYSGEHTGPVWCMKFSGCGRLLATAGQDHVLRVWVLKQAFNYFLDIRTKCNADIKVRNFTFHLMMHISFDYCL